MLHELRGWFQHDIQSSGTKICQCFWDDVATNIKVYFWPEDFTGFPDTGLATLATFGNTINSSEGNDWALTNTKSNYFFCDASELNEFFSQPTFPYFNKQETQNSPTCAVIACDLRIRRPLGITDSNSTVVGSGDGIVTLKATSSQSGIQFSLDNITFDTGILVDGFYQFTYPNLDVGTWIAYSKDSENCTDQVPFEIGFVDAYQIKYQAQFTQNDFVYFINFLKRDYVGPIIPVLVAKGGAANFIYGQENDDPWKVIKGGFWELTLKRGKANPIDTFEDFATQDERLFRVEVFKGNALDWKGWLLADKLIDQWTNAPSTFKVNAKDGLGSLKEFEFKAIDTSEFQGNRTIIEIIEICLDKLDLDLDIYSAANIRSQDHEDTDDPLENTKINIDSLDGLNCYEVIERLLFHYNIYQNKGRWVIAPFNNTEDLTFNIFQNGVNVGVSSEPVSKALTQLGSTKLARISPTGIGQAFLSTEFAIKESNVLQDYGLKEDLIFNSSFKDWTNGVPDGWTGDAISSGNVQQAPNRNKESTLTILGEAPSNILGEFITAKAFDLDIVTGSNAEAATIFMKVKGDFTQATQVSLRFQWTDGVIFKFLNNDANFWDSDVDNRVRVTLTNKNSYADVEIPMIFNGAAGSYTLSIFQGHSSTGSVTSLTFDYVEVIYKVDREAPESDTTWTAINQDKSTILVNNEEVFFGNAPVLENTEIIYQGALLNLNNQPLDLFRRGVNNEAISYADIFARNIITAKGVQLKSWSGNVSLRGGAVLDQFSIVKLREVEDILYRVIFWRANIPDQDYRVFLLEVTESEIIEPPNPILFYTNGDGILYPDLTNIGLENGPNNVGGLQQAGVVGTALDDIFYVVDSGEANLEFQNKKTTVQDMEDYAGGGGTIPSGTGVLYNNAGVLALNTKLFESSGMLIENAMRFFNAEGAGEVRQYREGFSVGPSDSNETIVIHTATIGETLIIEIITTVINNDDSGDYETNRITAKVNEFSGALQINDTTSFNRNSGNPYTVTFTGSGLDLELNFTNETASEFLLYKVGVIKTTL